MNWKKWKIGLVISLALGVLTAGAGLADQMSWKSFVAVLCAAVLSNLFSFLKQHPIESVQDEDRRTGPGAIAPVIAFACGLFLLSGCATTGGVATSPGTNATPAELVRAQRIGTVAELAAFSGTQVWLLEHPADRAYFEASAAALDVLLQSGEVSPEKFSAALSKLPIKELQGNEGTLIVGSTMILYDAFLAEHVNLDANIYLRPIIAGVRSGLGRGLTGSAPSR